MARLDLRVHLLGRLLRAAGSIASMDDAQLRAAQQRQLGHNAVTDLLFGGVAAGVDLRDTTAAGETGPLTVRVYRPKAASAEPLPLVVYFHGGGFVMGYIGASDWLCSNVALSVGVVVVSVDYRLAPAHPWPAATEDAYSALVDVAARAGEFGADAGRLAVMGDSSGGNLGAVVALMARDRSGPRIALQVLIYPLTDMTYSSPSIRENAHAPVVTEADGLACRDLYLGDLDRCHPYASPLHAPDHSGLPPALIQVAEHDPIRDDGLRYAAALESAGVRVRITTYVGMPHGYLQFPWFCRSAPQALGEICAELHAALDPLARADDGHPARRGEVLAR